MIIKLTNCVQFCNSGVSCWKNFHFHLYESLVLETLPPSSQQLVPLCMMNLKRDIFVVLPVELSFQSISLLCLLSLILILDLNEKYLSKTFSIELLSVCFISRFVGEAQQMSIVTHPAYEEQEKQACKVTIRKRNQMPWRPKLGDQKRISRLDKDASNSKYWGDGEIR